jgi:hypothetical protein
MVAIRTHAERFRCLSPAAADESPVMMMEMVQLWTITV